MDHISLNAQHVAPPVIRTEVATALSYYPELEDTPIVFKFKKNIRKSTMQAQPDFWSLFRSREKRSYKILISEKFKISSEEFRTCDLPPDILVGWLGHELGHLVDYKERSAVNLLFFGVKYLLSPRHIRRAERTADALAVARGMDDYILRTKEFILNHTDITLRYKNRIEKYYMSPEEIMLLLREAGESE